MDKRIEKLAKVLLQYSVELKPKELFRIRGEFQAAPLVKALYKEALLMGAHPYVDIDLPDTQEIFFKYANDEQLKTIPVLREYEVDQMDAYISIWGNANTKYLSGADPKKQQLWAQTTRPLMEKFFKKMADRKIKWCGTQFPTQAHAQDAEMSLDDYTEFVFNAGHLHEDDPVAYWKSVEAEQDRLVKILNEIEQLHIRADGTDIKMITKGRKWINCCGQENFPDGEIFTGPIEDTAEGEIRFSYPAFYQGREVEGVSLKFKDGVAQEAKAGKNEEFLLSMLDMDEGGRRIGEIAIGTNYEIQKFTKNTLFDEKIGGTCHMALGASIPESGGVNKSGFHWDMVCDLHQGEILADGKVIYRNGKFEI